MFTSSRSGRRLLLPALAVALAAGVAFAFFQGTRATARVKAANRDTAIDAVTGSVVVDAEGGFKELRSEAAGKVVTAILRPGTHFRKGEVLVQLDTTELDRQISETRRKHGTDKARARLLLENNPERKVAEERLATARRLFELGNAPEEEVKGLQRALDEIDRRLRLTEFDDRKGDDDFKVAMEALELQRERMRVTAPFDGTIHNTGALTWEGALINAGQPVALVFSRKRIVIAKISEESFGRVKLGQGARIRLLTYGTQNFDATVSELLPAADDAQRFTVHLDVKADPELLRPLSTGEVTITVDSVPDQIMVLRRSLFDGNKVLVVRDGRVERRTLEVGYVSLNNAQVKRGLAVGELVIVDQLEDFREGQRVKVEVAF
ncbi:MAG: efflux RND transporter periplasmic adaptor subunit [Verrucomicrobia bacterium]|nr:efflux RND transporter periplasmic adaptor subunit [Verrucomicrobiota bacterium]